eukprot:4208001-Amphidinium_carterae.1
MLAATEELQNRRDNSSRGPPAHPDDREVLKDRHVGGAFLEACAPSRKTGSTTRLANKCQREEPTNDVALSHARARASTLSKSNSHKLDDWS